MKTHQFLLQLHIYCSHFNFLRNCQPTFNGLYLDAFKHLRGMKRNKKYKKLCTSSCRRLARQNVLQSVVIASATKCSRSIHTLSSTYVHSKESMRHHLMHIFFVACIDAMNRRHKLIPDRTNMTRHTRSTWSHLAKLSQHSSKESHDLW